MSRAAPAMVPLGGAEDASPLERARAVAAQATRSAPEAAPAFVPVPREAPIHVEWQHPETGIVHVTDVRGRVSDADTDRLRTALLANLTGHVAWDVLAPHDRHVAIGRARAATQLVEPPRWLLDALSLDDDLAILVGGALVAHESRFFCRDAGAGDVPSRVLVVRGVGSAAPADRG